MSREGPFENLNFEMLCGCVWAMKKFTKLFGEYFHWGVLNLNSHAGLSCSLEEWQIVKKLFME